MDTRCSVCGKEHSAWVQRWGTGNYVRYCAEHVPKDFIDSMLEGMGPRARVKLRQVLGSRGNPNV